MDEQITPGMRIVSIPQAAAEGLLNVSALRTLVREGTIPSMMIGSRAYINLDVARDIVYKLSVRGAKKEDKTEDDMPVETNDPEGNSMAPIVPERFYTSSEVREILRIGKSAYYKLIERRDMPHKVSLGVDKNGKRIQKSVTGVTREEVQKKITEILYRQNHSNSRDKNCEHPLASARGFLFVRR